MRARAAGGLVALALAASSACTITRPFDLHPDAVALAVLLVAGEREARLLAIHPNRERGDPAPEIAASVGGMSPFSSSLPLEACRFAVNWPGPASCLRAELGSAIQPASPYRIDGTAPLGSFTGTTVVPGQPMLLAPRDTLHLSLPNEPGVIPLSVRHVAGPDIGTVLLEVLDVFEVREDGTETEIPAGRLGSFPQVITRNEDHTVGIHHDARPLRFSLRLVGIGWNYTNFVNASETRDPILPPWPRFGIGGDGAWGYFDGLTRSGTTQVVVR